jgi:hypothetical protein
MHKEQSLIARAHITCARAALAAVAYKSEELLRDAWDAIGLFENARENFIYDTTLGRTDYTPAAGPSGELDWPSLAVALDKTWPAAQSHWTPRGDLDAKARFLIDAAFKMLAERKTHDIGNDDRRLQDSRQYLVAAWDLVLTLLGAARIVSRKVETHVLLVEDRFDQGKVVDDGFLVRLSLACIPDGVGAFYPAPELAFVARPRIRRPKQGSSEVSNDFRDSEYNAGVIVRERFKLWDQPCDVRWTIKSRNPRHPLPLQLSGPSAGLAFTMGLGQVLLPET